MVYVKKWSEFQAQSLDLFVRSPEKTRYLIKATPSEQWLILKVTDDQTCLKFRARSAIIINRFEAFTRAMTARMAGLPDVAAGLATSTANSVTPNVDISSAGTVSKATSSTAQQTTASSAAAKKKKKKGKK